MSVLLTKDADEYVAEVMPGALTVPVPLHAPVTVELETEAPAAPARVSIANSPAPRRTSRDNRRFNIHTPRSSVHGTALTKGI